MAGNVTDPIKNRMHRFTNLFLTRTNVKCSVMAWFAYGWLDVKNDKGTPINVTRISHKSVVTL